MSSRDISSPRLPLPIGNVDQAYIIDLVRALDLFIQQSDNPGEGRNTKLVFTDMPTSDIGLEPGTLYRIGNDVKIAAKSGVFNNLADGVSVMGNPAVNMYKFIKSYKKTHGKR